MKQLLQDLSNGQTYVIEAPSPNPSAGTLLINTKTSLISAGTERMVVDFGKANLLDKARQQPDKVKVVLEKVKTDGLMTTVDAVRSKLSQPIPLGYSNVGVVAEVGTGVEGFKSGDRVVSNGRHADVVRVPRNLCARIPDSINDDTAAFTIVASIGLQGIRLAKPTLGECFVVIGVGLIGLLTVQLLRAQGCRVLAMDIDDNKLALAESFGADIYNSGKGSDPVAAGMAFSRGIGVDAVIVTASTKSNAPVTDAARMSRKRGRIVLVGVTGINLSRADFYEKELSFQVSCSYGPGRYDREYEDQGKDYPIGFVRWTEQRNFEAVLEMMADGRLVVDQLISHRFAFEVAANAYQTLSKEKNVLGILLAYTDEPEERHKKHVALAGRQKIDDRKPVVSFIGAGNYASRVLMPAFKAAGAQLHTIGTSSGTSGVFHGGKSGFLEATTDIDALLANDEINTVVIVTRHNTHARFVNKALTAGKNVFVEKPLALTFEELSEIESAYQAAQMHGQTPRLMVGFNRRFSPLVEKIKAFLCTSQEPKSFIMTMNAGYIPSDHWVQDLSRGGGRIIGEACHYIDLMRYLADSEIVSVQARRMGNTDSVDITEDKAMILLGFKDGSFGCINYLANGHKGFPKERVEVFTAGKIFQIDNFRTLTGFGWNGFKKKRLRKQDKGQSACPAAFIDAIEKGKDSPIPVQDIFEVARATLEVADQLRNQ